MCTHTQLRVQYFVVQPTEVIIRGYSKLVKGNDLLDDLYVAFSANKQSLTHSGYPNGENK